MRALGLVRDEGKDLHKIVTARNTKRLPSAKNERRDEGRGPGPGAGKTRHDLPASAGLTVSDSAAEPLDQGPTGSWPERLLADCEAVLGKITKGNVV